MTGSGLTGEKASAPRGIEPPARRRRGRGRDGADTRTALLRAGRAAFAAGGLEGARVDEIAARAGVNKQLVYHYFNSKEGLYTAVLEEAYQEIRQQEQGLDLSQLPPREALQRLVEFSFDYLDGHRDFVALIADENKHGARHIAGSAKLAATNRPIVVLMRETLERGAAAGQFRDGLDALQIYLSVAGLTYFTFANMHTLSQIFDLDLRRADAIATRRAHVVDFVLAAVARR